MAQVLTELVAKITTDASGLKRGMSDAEKTTEVSSQKMQASIRQVGIAMVAIGGAITAAMGFATKASMDYELAFTGVRKTVEATEAEFEVMNKEIKELSTNLPVIAKDLAAIAETAGQLGIAKENILDFTEVVAGLGIATDIAGQDGATMIARFSAITNMPESKFKNLASAVVELGNNSKATEAEIMTMAMRIGGTATVVGMTEQEILGLATAMVGLGIPAERGGTALSKVMLEMNSAVAEGSEKLAIWADMAGISAEKFADYFREDAMGAVIDVIGGIKDLNDAGEDTAGMLQSVGVGGTRAVDSLFKLAVAEGEVANKVNMANEAWEENIALDEEVGKFSKALTKQWTILTNVMNVFAIAIGDKLAPILQGFIDFLKPIIEGITKWTEAHPDLTKYIVITVAAIGGLLLALGGLLLIIPLLSSGFAAFGITMSAAIWPITLIVAAIAGLIAIGFVVVKNFKDIKLWVLNTFDAILSKLENFLPFLGKVREAIADMIADEEVKEKAKAVEETNAEMVEQLKKDAETLTKTLKDEATKRYNTEIELIKETREAEKQAYDEKIDNIKSEYGYAEDTAKSLIQLEYDKRDAAVQAIQDREDAAEDAYKNELSRIDRLYRDSLSQAQKKLRDQIEAIDQQTDAEEMAMARQEEQEKLTALNSAILSATTDEEKAKATEEYAEYKTEVERRELLRSRSNAKDILRQQIDDLREGIGTEADALKVARDKQIKLAEEAREEALENERTYRKEQETLATDTFNTNVGLLEDERDKHLETLKEKYEGENGVFAKLDEEQETKTANHIQYLKELDAELKKFVEDQNAKYESAKEFVDGLNALTIDDKSYTVTVYHESVEVGGELNYSPADNYAGGFATGGVVPGPVGAPILATVHGGETVIPANQSTGGITVNIAGPLFMEREDQMNQLVAKIKKGLQRSDRLGYGAPYSG